MGVIKTSQANCKDCYKCIRLCPMKAIRVTGGHAEVVDELCVHDGSCLNVCPQKAKEFRRDVEVVKNFIKGGNEVVASVAPSFAAALGLEKPKKLLRALVELGFSRVEETAVGAYQVALAHRRMYRERKSMLISSACPAVNELIGKYYPHLLPYLAPVVSPMVAHARMLKAQGGAKTRVVFIGPCVAKKAEMVDLNVSGAVDAVLTFTELQAWLDEEGITIASLPEKDFDAPCPGFARLFPAAGGLLKTASLPDSSLDPAMLTITGLDDCKTFLEGCDTPEKMPSGIVEMMACPGGCLNGPCMGTKDNIFVRRAKLLAYAGQEGKAPSPGQPPEILHVELARSYAAKPVRKVDLSPEYMAKLLARLGKYSPEDELNCGACGYNSCREKALAVHLGLAEVEMCIPHMRSKAESLATMVVYASPNGIVIVDKDLKITEVNPAFEKMFKCLQERVKGKPIGSLVDAAAFREVLESGGMVTGDTDYPQYGLKVKQKVFFMPEHDAAVGIFIDVTGEMKQKELLNKVTKETLEKAQEVIDKQMRVAHEIAGLLGETTAETKVLLTKLMRLMQSEEGK